MRLFKLMVCCALLCSVALVGCNKDENDVVVEETILEAGEFTVMTLAVTGCDDESDNYVDSDAPECETQGCVKMILNEDMTAEFVWHLDGTNEVMSSGVYTITNDRIAVTLSDGEDEFPLEGPITSSTTFNLLEVDKDDNCNYNYEYSK